MAEIVDAWPWAWLEMLTGLCVEGKGWEGWILGAPGHGKVRVEGLGLRVGWGSEE